jgi:hypothetical protein
MKRLLWHRLLLKSLIETTAAFSLMCVPAVAFAQHGGGHFSSGGHAGASAGHVGTPHVSAPVIPPAKIVPPIHIRTAVAAPLVGSAGTRGFVAIPPTVHLIAPPGIGRPVVGNRAIVWAGTPSAPGAQTNSAGLAFSGDGRRRFSTLRSEWGLDDAVRRRRRFPILGFPVFGFGAPGFGLGWGLGGPCGAFWGWDYGCNALPFYGYGYGNYGYSSGDNLEGQVEEQSGPLIYENPLALAPEPGYLYGDGGRELVQLYLKDGTVYSAADYWIVNDELHFTTVDASGRQPIEHTINSDQLALQKTIDVNTQRGFRFVLRNQSFEQYLQEHPDATPLDGATPERGPAGPILPSQAPQP